MNKEWSLDVLYKGYDDPKFAADEARMDELIAEFTEFSKDPSGDPAEVLKKAITMEQELTALMSDLFEYAMLRMSTNSSDVESKAAAGRLARKRSGLAAPETALTNYIAGLEDLDAVIGEDELLKEHEFFLKSIKDDAKYTLSPEVEEVMSLYSITGASAWSELHGYLTSTVPVEYDGRVTNLSEVRNLAYDPDPEVRKRAYEAEIKCYDRIRDGSAFSLNSIKMEVINRCRLRGFESPLDETLHQSHMKKETLDALLGAIEEYLPKFWEYLRAKAELLGHKNGLPFYDLFAPLEGNTDTYTTEEAKEYLVRLFSTFDKDEADMIARAFDEAWIDFYPHEGKGGGAFCSPLHTHKQSRIGTNYGGMLGDVITLAHELGHAFHNFCLQDNSILNIDVSMPVAETASTFNEVVAMNAAIAEQKDPVVRRALIENQLQDATQVVVDIYSRYLFEKSVFDNRENGFMFADRLCELMENAQKKAYGTGLDPDCLHPYMWVCKGHYYGGGLSYYNWPYAFGGLFARGLYAKYLEQGEEFVPLYKKLLKATGTTTVEGAAEVAGIDLTDKDFWRASLQVLADEIDQFVELCKN